VRYVPGTVAATSLAELDGASQLLTTPLLHQDELPALIEHLLDLVGNVDDAGGRDKVVILLDVAVVELLVPEAVGRFAELVHAVNLAAVHYAALAAQRRQRANVGVHRGEDLARVDGLAPDILRAVEPVDAYRVHGSGGVVPGVQELHDAAQVVGLAGGFTDEIHMICGVCSLAKALQQ